MDDMMKASSAWLKVVKSLKGGKDVELFLEFPVVANTDDGTFNFVVVADELDPVVKTWGLKATEDKWWEFAVCTGSSLWHSVKIK